GSAGVVSAGGTPDSITFQADSPGSITIGVTEANGAGDSATSPSLTLRVAAPAVAPVVSVPANVTAGIAFTATAPARAGFTYGWTVNGSPAGSTTSAGPTSVIVTFGTLGALPLAVTESNGVDSTATGTATTNVVATARNAFSISAPASATENTTLTASITAVQGATYAWTVDGDTAAITSAGGGAGFARDSTHA